MDARFTSHMEEELDDVEAAKMDWLQVVREFWQPFSEALARAADEMESAKNHVAEDAGPCPECGKPLVKRWSKRGPFLGCSGYPECKYTRPLEGEGGPRMEPKRTEHKCEKCGGAMMLRMNKRGEPFLGCENFPKCRFTMPSDDQGNPVRPEPTGEVCEKCGSPMLVKHGRRGPFLGCSAFPKCRSTKPLPKDKAGKSEPGGQAKGEAKTKDAPRSRPKPAQTDRTCPDCGEPMLLRTGRRGPFLGCSGYPKCRHTEDVPADMEVPDQAGGG
jgi:DNA topoisomerase-1